MSDVVVPYGETLIDRIDMEPAVWLLWRVRITNDGRVEPEGWELVGVMGDEGASRNLAMTKYREERSRDVCVQRWVIGTTEPDDELWWASWSDAA